MIDLEQFSRRHWGPLRRHAYRLTGSLLDAEDAVQETMLRAVEMGPALDNVGDPAEWLHVAATEAALALLHEHPPLALEAFELPDFVQTPGPGSGAPPFAGEEGWPGVTLAFLFPLQYMEPEQRAVVVLRDALEDGDRIAASALSATLPEVFQIAEAAERRRAEVRRRWGRNVPFAPLQDDPASARAFAKFTEALGFRDKALLQGLLLGEAELIGSGRRETGRDFVAAALAELLGEAGDDVRFTPVWLNGCRGLLVWVWQERRDEWQRAAALLAVCGESQVRALKWETDGHILRSIRAGEPEG
ncbi:MAG: sigma factor [Nitrospinota bacterium]